MTIDSAPQVDIRRVKLAVSEYPPVSSENLDEDARVKGRHRSIRWSGNAGPIDPLNLIGSFKFGFPTFRQVAPHLHLGIYAPDHCRRISRGHFPQGGQVKQVYDLSLPETLPGSCDGLAGEARHWQMRGRAMCLEWRIERRENLGEGLLLADQVARSSRPEERRSLVLHS